MEPRAYTQRPAESAKKDSAEQPRSAGLPDGPQLAGLQTSLLEGLRESGGPLTVKQLEARVPSAAGEMEQALEDLVERRLLLRLNTIIPTYGVNSESHQVSGG